MAEKEAKKLRHPNVARHTKKNIFLIKKVCEQPKKCHVVFKRPISFRIKLILSAHISLLLSQFQNLI